MFKIRFQSTLPALLCATALLTFACNRGEEDRTGQVSGTPDTAAQAQVQPQANELLPEPQSVEVPETPPPAVAEPQVDRASELAAKEAELNARERRLRERERREATRPPAPDPEPEESSAEAAPAPSPEPEPIDEEPLPEAAPEPPRTVTVTVPAGTTLDVEFTKTVASNASSPGETFRVRVAHAVTADGEVAIPAGSEILGEVTEAVPLRKVGGQARLGLHFTDLVLPSGATVPIEASFVQQGRSETGKDAATIGGGAAAGAILGRILGKGNRSKGSVIGAILGAAAGTAIASKTPGEEVVIPEGTVLSLSLNDSVAVRVSSRQ